MATGIAVLRIPFDYRKMPLVKFLIPATSLLFVTPSIPLVFLKLSLHSQCLPGDINMLFLGSYASLGWCQWFDWLDKSEFEEPHVHTYRHQPGQICRASFLEAL